MSSSSLINKFASETGIFGLNLLKCGQSKFDLLFWSVFVAVFACYTTKSLVDISVKFLGEETTTSVYQKSRNEFYLPDPLVCLYGSTNLIAKSGSRNFETQAILEEYLTTGDLNATNFLYAFNFVHELYKLEISSVPSTESLHYSDFSSMAAFDDVITILRALSLHTSRDLLTNISDFLFVKLCNAFELTLSFKNNTLSDDSVPACKRENILIPTDSGDNFASICIKLEADMFVFRSGEDHVNIEFKFNESTLRECVGLDEVGTNLFFVSDGHYYLRGGAITDYDSRVEILAHTRRHYYVRLNAAYDNLDLRRRRCDLNRTRSALCNATCEARFYLAAYGCLPLRFVTLQLHELQLNWRRCEADDYLKFTSRQRFASKSIDNLSECRRACFEPCTKPIFSVISAETSLGGKRTVAKILVQSHVYTHVDERLANDFESFLSNFGGALGLWLGASFASVVHIPIFAIQSILRYFWRKKHLENGASIEMAQAHGELASGELVKKVDALAAKLADLTSRLEAMEKA